MSEQLDSEIKMNRVCIDGLNRLKESYLIYPLKGDPEAVQKSILDEERQLFFQQIERFKLMTKIDAIIQEVGEFPPDSKLHEFKPAKFPMPANCDYCHNIIWSMTSKHGLKCKTCNYRAHVKCELKLPPNCSKIKRVYKPKAENIAVLKPVVSHSYPGPNESLITRLTLPRRVTFDNLDPPVDTKLDNNNAEASLIGEYFNEPEEEDEMEVGQDAQEPAELDNIIPIPAGAPAIVSFNYNAADDTEATVREGDKVLVVKPDSGGWTIIAKHHTTGAVPTSYLQPLIPNVGSSTTINEEPVITVT